MRAENEPGRRRSVRLRGYDYRQTGAYFVTVCARERACLFGAVVDGEMSLNEVGQIVRAEWLRAAEVRAPVALDVFVVMPNHVHGIVVIDAEPMETSPDAGPAPSVSRGPVSGSIGAIVGQFKAASTKRIRRHLERPDWVVWQRNYHEHVIRDEESLNRIRQYILDNPPRWAFDRENPASIRPEPEDSWRAEGDPPGRPYPNPPAIIR